MMQEELSQYGIRVESYDEQNEDETEENIIALLPLKQAINYVTALKTYASICDSDVLSFQLKEQCSSCFNSVLKALLQAQLIEEQTNSRQSSIRDFFVPLYDERM